MVQNKNSTKIDSPVRIEYFVYIVSCKDKTLYTGYTNNLNNRITAHNTLNTAAKYTKSRRPVKLVYFEKFDTKNQAMKREASIKKMTRKQKLDIIKK